MPNLEESCQACQADGTLRFLCYSRPKHTLSKTSTPHERVMVKGAIFGELEGRITGRPVTDRPTSLQRHAAKGGPQSPAYPAVRPVSEPSRHMAATIIWYGPRSEDPTSFYGTSLAASRLRKVHTAVIPSGESLEKTIFTPLVPTYNKPSHPKTTSFQTGPGLKL
jgi:hypothetical protein